MKTTAFRTAAVLGAAVGVLLVCEIGIRLGLRLQQRIFREGSSDEPAMHVLCDRPFLYQLNPEHPEIGSQGLRGRDYAIPKPETTRRVLVLGDSVTFGAGVSPEETFCSLLEGELRLRHGDVEVINAGVNGYTPYNELQYYLHQGRLYEPDIVIVGLCLNDVVDPTLHWTRTGRAVKNIPDQAIPNLTYHRDHVLPLAASRSGAGRRSLLQRSALYRYIAPQREDAVRRRRTDRVERRAWVDGRWWPTDITGEDSISITVLMDYESPEWRWLRGMVDQLHDAVLADRARLVILVLPLAYQLDEGYPYLPQGFIARYCNERSIPCVDVLPAFREGQGEETFLMRMSGFRDIWHLAPGGHRIVAREIRDGLSEHGLLD